MTNLRIGHGYDVHRLAAGRKLILGGVDIPYEKGLEGHSDADVLVTTCAGFVLCGEEKCLVDAGLLAQRRFCLAQLGDAFAYSIDVTVDGIAV